MKTDGSGPVISPARQRDPAYQVFPDSIDYPPRRRGRAHQGRVRLLGARPRRPDAHLGRAPSRIRWRSPAPWSNGAWMAPPSPLLSCMTFSKTRRRASARLADKFGREAADLVDGLSKLDRMEFASYQEAQAENFPQDADGDGARPARRADQAGGPPAQPADHGRGAPRQAPAHCHRDPRHLRADRLAPGIEQALPRNAGPVISS